MCSFIRRLAKNQRGAIAIMGALLLVPVISMMAIGVEVTRYLTKQTRLVQAQSSAAYAIAKEGRTADMGQRNKLMNAYILENLVSVRDKGDVVSNKCVAVNLDSDRIVSRFEPKCLFGQILNVVVINYYMKFIN